MATVLMSTPWLANYRPKTGAKLRLFCFPYAGGNSIIYRNWGEHLPNNVELCAVQLPGRGNRLREAPFTQVPALVQATAQALLPYMDKPFAFFGHSMGAIISFELAHLLRRQHGIEPRQLFVSGRTAPHVTVTHPLTYNLPEREFVEELRRLNGTPKEVLEHPELMELMIPLLRADFEVCQTYKPTDGPPLSCPINAFGGSEDEDIPREHMEAWRDETSGSFELRMFAGDHFFLHNCEAALLQTLSGDLRQLIDKLP